jgi:hypothetical protein
MNSKLRLPINDWLIDYLRFYVLLKNISLIWRRHHCRWRAAKFRPMLGAQGLWAGRWLIDYLRFYVPFKNISLIWRRHHCRWRAAKFRPMLSAQGLWAGRDLYRVTPAVTQDLVLSGHIRSTAPFSRLLRHTRECGGSILTRILTGEGSLSCHTCCDMWPRFIRSHPKDRPI